MSDDLFDRLVTGRPLALDRSARPALASRAAMQAKGATLEQLARQRAGTGDGRDGGLAVQLVGSTAVVPLIGFITSDPFLAWIFGGTSPDALVRALQQAIADPVVKNIVLLVDSPGGEVALVPEAAAEIRRLRAIKPITAIARTTMASAAYWLAAQASSVVATPSGNVGSVGVFLVHTEDSRLLDEAGITVTYIASDPRKVEANPDEPLADDARAFLQSQVDAVYGMFIADLAAGRRAPAARVRADYGGGRCFSAAEALSRGMVDRVATLDQVLAGAAGAGGGYDRRSQASIDEEMILLSAISVDL